MRDDIDYIYDPSLVYGDDICTEGCLDEIWVELDEAWGYYLSNYGRLWSGHSQSFLKPKRLDRHGHLGFCLQVYGGRRKYVYLHRLMGKYFIPNPCGYPLVRHLNDNPEDNDLDNLAWGTQVHNWEDSVRNGTAQLPRDEWREIGLEKIRKPVLGTQIKTGVQRKFRSQTDAARELGLQQANIGKVLYGQRAHTGGWFFEFIPKEELDD